MRRSRISRECSQPALPRSKFRCLANQPFAASNRCGAIIVFAMIMLLVASLLTAALLKTAAISHRQLQRDEYRIQASLLADAGTTRALRRLKAEPDFSREDWTLSAEELASSRTGLVHLAVAADPEHPARRVLSIVAEYPVGHSDVIRVSRKINIPGK